MKTLIYKLLVVYSAFIRFDPCPIDLCMIGIYQNAGDINPSRLSKTIKYVYFACNCRFAVYVRGIVIAIPFQFSISMTPITPSRTKSSSRLQRWILWYLGSRLGVDRCYLYVRIHFAATWMPSGSLAVHNWGMKWRRMAVTGCCFPRTEEASDDGNWRHSWKV